MGRTSFAEPDSHVVVSSDGYFDVFAPGIRAENDKPAYRGLLAALGAGLRSTDDRLAVRPDSPRLAEAVAGWSALHGEAAVRGDLGKGRDGTEEKE